MSVHNWKAAAKAYRKEAHVNFLQYQQYRRMYRVATGELPDGYVCDTCGWRHDGECPPRERWRSWELRAREAEQVIADLARILRQGKAK